MNPIALNLGIINIYWYSLFIALGAFIGLLIAIKEAKRHNISKEFIIDTALWGLPLGIIGARIYYVIFNFDYYSNNLLDILKINEGGLAIHGGIIVGLSFAYLYSKKKGYNPIKLLDIFSVSFLIGQIFGRWGNFFNKEAHGGKVTLNFLERLHLPNFIIEGMYINGSYYHPAFLYESIWNIIGLIFLLIYRKNKNIKLGEITLIYLIWYSFGRFFIEYLRTDSLMIGNIKMAMLLSAILFIGSLIILILLKLKSKKQYNEGDKYEN